MLLTTTALATYRAVLNASDKGLGLLALRADANRIRLRTYAHVANIDIVATRGQAKPGLVTERDVVASGRTTCNISIGPNGGVLCCPWYSSTAH